MPPSSCTGSTSLQQQWAARSYHEDSRNSVRAVIYRFLGHYDANPADLIPLSPANSAPRYVEMMGGSARILPGTAPQAKTEPPKPFEVTGVLDSD